MSIMTHEATPESVWALIQEVSQQQKETDRILRELGRETDQKMQETAQQMKETDRILHELGRETDQKMQETAQQMKETDRILHELGRETDWKMQETAREIKEAKYLFTTQWGSLIESLVEGRIVELFNQRGIPVYDTSTRVKGHRNGRSYEFDIIAHNGDRVVIVEVKTTLRPGDVWKFVKKLEDAKVLMPRYRDNVIHGAMAWLRTNAGADEIAVDQKLFSIRAVGDSARIVNAADFQPKAF